MTLPCFKIWNRRFFEENFLWVAFLFLNFGLPVFFNRLGSSGAILVNSSLMILILAVFVRKRLTISFNTSDEKKAFCFFQLIFYLNGLLISLSILFSSFNLIDRDIFELHRAPLNSLLFIFAYFLPPKLISERHLYRVFLIIWVFLLLMGLAQFFRMNDWFFLQYVKSNLIVQKRISAPFTNPYDYGFVMILFFSVFVIRFVKRPKLAELGMSLLSLLAIIATQSRGIFLGIFLTFIFGLLLLVRQNVKTQGKVLGYSSFLIFFAVIVLYLTNFSFLSRFNYLFNGLASFASGIEVKSVSIRSQQFFDIVDFLGVDPWRWLFGNGPSKSAGFGLESIYSYYFFRYGLLGFLFGFLTPLVLFLTVTIKYLKKQPGSTLIIAIGFWLLTVPMLSITNNFTEQVRVQGFYVALMGYVFRMYHLKGSIFRSNEV